MEGPLLVSDAWHQSANVAGLNATQQACVAGMGLSRVATGNVVVSLG